MSRPTGRDTGDFYQRVADAYSEVRARTYAVAPALAEEADVPVRTVHRWIAEARRRGLIASPRLEQAARLRAQAERIEREAGAH